METIRGCWSVKELERQIHSLYYERSGLSQNKEALSALVQQQAAQLRPKDVINTPVTLEFLGLNDRALVTESDLEQSTLDNLQNFLLEMGHGFCFEARQKRILIDGDYYFADLVFYHRILKCHIIVELKIDRFRHEYASQLNMYLNYYKAEIMQPDDNPPVGILLCTEKGDTLVKYATAGLDPNIFVQKYMVELPTEDEIKKFISREINGEIAEYKSASNNYQTIFVNYCELCHSISFECLSVLWKIISIFVFVEQSTYILKVFSHSPSKKMWQFSMMQGRRTALILV